jgi:hypothetical protein
LQKKGEKFRVHRSELTKGNSKNSEVSNLRFWVCRREREREFCAYWCCRAKENDIWFFTTLDFRIINDSFFFCNNKWLSMPNIIFLVQYNFSILNDKYWYYCGFDFVIFSKIQFLSKNRLIWAILMIYRYYPLMRQWHYLKSNFHFK